MHFHRASLRGRSDELVDPNRACVEAMLRSAGFEILDHPEEEVYICSAACRPPDAAVYPPQEARDG